MANPEHLAILKQGIEAWNKRWAETANESGFDLSNTDLESADLSNAIFTFVNLDGAKLSNARGSNYHRAWPGTTCCPN